MKVTLKTSILITGLILSLSAACQRTNKINQEEAIKLAEKFIIDNGYTSLSADRHNLQYEFLYDDNVKNVDSLLKSRYNTLYPKAFCIAEDPDRWNIGFLSTTIEIAKLDSIQRNDNLSGRAVIIIKSNRKISMAHKEPLFSSFKKL